MYHITKKTDDRTLYLAETTTHDDKTIWTNDRDEAQQFEELTSAEQLADDWNEFFSAKGRSDRAEVEKAPKVRSVSLIPDWKTAAQIYIMALENGTGTGPQAAREGIMEMATKFDNLIAQMNKEEG